MSTCQVRLKHGQEVYERIVESKAQKHRMKRNEGETGDSPSVHLMKMAWHSLMIRTMARSMSSGANLQATSIMKFARYTCGRRDSLNLLGCSQISAATDVLSRTESNNFPLRQQRLNIWVKDKLDQLHRHFSTSAIREARAVRLHEHSPNLYLKYNRC